MLQWPRCGVHVCWRTSAMEDTAPWWSTGPWPPASSTGAPLSHAPHRCSGCPPRSSAVPQSGTPCYAPGPPTLHPASSRPGGPPHPGLPVPQPSPCPRNPGYSGRGLVFTPTDPPPGLRLQPPTAVPQDPRRTPALDSPLPPAHSPPPWLLALTMAAAARLPPSPRNHPAPFHRPRPRDSPCHSHAALAAEN